jgi:signal peptidase I
VKKNSTFAITICALLLALFFRTFIISVYKIPTHSMEPTFFPGDFIFASRISYGLKFPWSTDIWFQTKPQKGDLVIFKFKGKPTISYVKRVVAVEGESVQISGQPQLVPAGEVFVANDNPAISEATNEGFALIEEIDSRAKLIWFSYSKDSGVRWNRILTFP